MTFTFRTQYDGYIYPNWKQKDKSVDKYYYEDAVVVGKDFIVLGDGLGKTKGLSGIFAIHQCLRVAICLAKSKQTTIAGLTKEVLAASDEAKKQLEFKKIDKKLRNVATTLVYIKLQGSTLLTGSIGDSGFMVFRFNSKSGVIELHYQSKETVHKFNTP